MIDDERGAPPWRRASSVYLALLLALVGAAVLLLQHRDATAGKPAGQPGPGQQLLTIAPAQPVTGVARAARLPATLATTFARLSAAPPDPFPSHATTGLVVHPAGPIALYTAPGGGAAFATLPTTQLGSPTWVPVVAARPGWAQVLLPSRPGHGTGWIVVTRQLQVARSPYLVDVDLARHRLTLVRNGRPVGSWPVAIGAPATPTPIGRTYLMASVTPATPTYSPLILPLATHSDTLDRYGGGPGTVALHSWPDPRVFGHSVSHGCVRVPAPALALLRSIPLGTLVLIH
ncbi:MAG: L,D-transpeptidase [Actinomycetota bacterium]|nr:L,D-transpeptidase [Actinomycetota bacterium]